MLRRKNISLTSRSVTVKDRVLTLFTSTRAVGAMTTGAVAKAIGLKREQAAEALLVQLEQEGKIKRFKPPDWDPNDEDVWVGV